MTVVDVFAKHGLRNAEALVRAADDVGLQLHIAAALAEKESGGRNIYGHDAGGALSTKTGPVSIGGETYPRGGDIPVTEANFTEYFLPAVLAGKISNGVGPLQITYPGYFKQRPDYPWWDPYKSALVGYTDFLGYLKGATTPAAIKTAGSRYNSGSYTKTAGTYGEALATLAAKWDTWLKSSTTEDSMPDPRFTKALSTLGNVTPNTRKKALAVLQHCQDTLGRTPGVLWGMGSSSEHASGRALDFMISQHGMGIDTEMGDAIAEFVLAHGVDWGLGWVIWRQRIFPPKGTFVQNPKGGWRRMEDRGSSTQNHMDHPHVYFAFDKYSNGHSTEPDQETDMTPQQFEQMMGKFHEISEKLTFLHDLFTPGIESVKYDGETYRQLRSINETLVQVRDGFAAEYEEDEAEDTAAHDNFGKEIQALQDGLEQLRGALSDLLARRNTPATT